MKRKGWWRQLRDNDYPETKKSYGQDIHALDTRMPQKKSGEKSVEYMLFCNACSHEKSLTHEYMKELSECLSRDISLANVALLQQELPKFICSCCGKKNVKLLSKPKEQKNPSPTRQRPTKGPIEPGRCQHCGAIAIPGDSVCYACAIR